MKRTLVSVKVSRTLAASGRVAKQNEIDDIRGRMKTPEQNARATIMNLKSDIKHEEDQLHEDLASSLRSRNFTERAFNFQEFPKISKEWKKVAKNANDIISDMISKEVDHWGNEYQRVDGLKTRILDKFSRECQVYEDQLKEIESK